MAARSWCLTGPGCGRFCGLGVALSSEVREPDGQLWHAAKRCPLVPICGFEITRFEIGLILGGLVAEEGGEPPTRDL